MYDWLFSMVLVFAFFCDSIQIFCREGRVSITMSYVRQLGAVFQQAACAVFNASQDASRLVGCNPASRDVWLRKHCCQKTSEKQPVAQVLFYTNKPCVQERQRVLLLLRSPCSSVLVRALR